MTEMVTMNDLQSRLQEMFESGARCSTDLEHEDNNYIFWVAAVPVLDDDVIAVKRLGEDRSVAFQFKGEPEFSEDGNSVIFRDARPFAAYDLAERSVRFDRWFDPVGLEEQVAAERGELLAEDWLKVIREDFAAERKAAGNG